MRRYAAIMVHAYSQISGRSLEEVTRDLHLEGIIDPEEIKELSEAENDYLQDILKSGEKVLPWQRSA